MSNVRPKKPPTPDPFNGTNNSMMSGTTNSTAASPVKPPSDFGIMVATRIRPFNKKELSEHLAACKTEGRDPNEPPAPVLDVERDGKTMILLDPKDYKSKASFNFDHVFTAFAPTVELLGMNSSKNLKRKGSSTDCATTLSDGDSSSDDESEEVVAERAQSQIYNALGAPLVRSAWDGYNTCIFAYGQTSSGKTYTMMGNKRDPGIIPRLCKDLFERIEEEEDNQKRGGRPKAETPLGDSSTMRSEAPVPPQGTSRKMIKVTVSYMEIYNEQVRDLLKVRPKNYKPKFNTSSSDNEEYQSLKVRQHPLHGPFVDGLTTVDVDNWLECVRIIRQGNEIRSHCATDMNESSSRSHAVFQMVLTQTEALGARVRGKDVTNHKVSKINLVDLAGSERIMRTNVTGKHLAEANSINQSLSTLRKVIDALVQRKKNANANLIVPYRESMLTWILSDNFGGNSKTVMCANVSPHGSNASETESTLRYATLARGIVNRIRVNEDPSAKLIRELQSQLKVLQEEMMRGPQQQRVGELQEEISANRRAMDELAAKEEGMKQLITESRAREEKLRNDMQEHQQGEERWKREAEKLRREKEELKKALSDIAKTNPELQGKLFGIDFGDTSESPKDDQMCPAPLSRRKSSMRLKSTASMVNKSSTTLDRSKLGAPVLSSDGSTSFNLDANSPDYSLNNGSQSGPKVTSSSNNGRTTPPPAAAPEASVTPADGPRFGRRAATEELKERPYPGGLGAAPMDGDLDGRPRSQQVLQGVMVRRGESGPSRASVPVSLQHLAGLTVLPPPSSGLFPQNPGSRSPSPQSAMDAKPTTPKPAVQPVKGGPPDALDAFLVGDANKKPDRGIPPWKRQK